MECTECSRLLAERERFDQAYKAAFDKMLIAGHVSSAEFILAGVTTDEARLDAEGRPSGTGAAQADSRQGELTWAESIMARDSKSRQRRIHLRRPNRHQQFPLANPRRTIHTDICS